MKIIYSENFKNRVRKLTLEEKRQLKKKLQIMIDNPRHPSLRTKKLKGRNDSIFEASVNMDIRITWQYVDGDIYLRNIGHHDTTLNNS